MIRVALVALSLALVGCGVKAPPKPPKPAAIRASTGSARTEPAPVRPEPVEGRTNPTHAP